MAPMMPMQTPEVEMNWYQRSVPVLGASQGLPAAADKGAGGRELTLASKRWIPGPGGGLGLGLAGRVKFTFPFPGVLGGRRTL